ncbi:acyltransferase family protein [Desmospora profundinema]|uniref:Fucose 4-O-acetylase-like acetyltransferase n=1 Tax=Desmospora profundinema TaxID=1571184 RepID=A0ABU1IN68_9BACL|nr:acyltransferase family protein [Desmospora profundinema]MDR6226235.1 fucose 4-O-acetylase-like acetyltransferase [Desmospora profundinema]
MSIPKPEEIKPRQRDYYFDNVKFLLVLLVVIGHAYASLIDDSTILKVSYLAIYSFHMPLFILIAGYFSKNIHKEDQSKKIIASILIPYVIFEILYSVYDHLLYGTDRIDISILEPYWIMWFLFSMFLWRLILPYFITLKYPLATAFALSIMIGYVDEADRYLSLSRTVAFFPFFLLGYLLQRHHFDWLFKSVKRWVAWIGLAALFPLMYGLEFLSPLDANWRQWMFFALPYEDVGHTEWYAGLYRLGLMALALMVSILFLVIVPRGKTVFSEWGARSIYVYLFHGFFIRAYTAFNWNELFSGPIFYLTVTLASVLLTILLSSKWVMAATHPLVQPKAHWIFHEKRSTRRLKNPSDATSS